ncbi:hypothetical protein D3C86_1093200 [compost metagenome]
MAKHALKMHFIPPLPMFANEVTAISSRPFAMTSGQKLRRSILTMCAVVTPGNFTRTKQSRKSVSSSSMFPVSLKASALRELSCSLSRASSFAKAFASSKYAASFSGNCLNLSNAFTCCSTVVACRSVSMA